MRLYRSGVTQHLRSNANRNAARTVRLNCSQSTGCGKNIMNNIYIYLFLNIHKIRKSKMSYLPAQSYTHSYRYIIRTDTVKYKNSHACVSGHS